MLHILQIDLQLVLHDDTNIVLLRVADIGQQLVLVAILDRGHIRNARTDVQDMHLLGSIIIDIMAHLGARAYQRHIAQEDIDELSQFVELILADIITRAGDAGIAATDRNQAAAVGILTHGAELVDAEILVVKAYAYLSVEDRPGRIELDPDCQHEEHGTQYQEAQATGYYIENSFHISSWSKLIICKQLVTK